ncbi:Vacuolar ATPase assembly integral membrane protein VMA21 [Toxocara canis]|uniref:Vacuolar ATPase assembly integral membrane protein VMA21 n=1 Tax=Toxocara canis TaxID=6265 RepID=A0A0B2VIB1_TOXCA|nr:Vacuolar ATPase assembly integral membrane protein VMA21 [Toxocara canis]
MDQFVPNLRDESVQTAVKNLLIYSLTIISVPLGSMFFLKKYLFEDYFGFDDATSALYAGGVAASIVLFFMVLFVWIAYREEKRDAMLFKKDV